MMTVSVIAMFFEILPVLIAAVVSAIGWNYLFIPPVYTFHIDNAEDVMMFLLYFVIAMVNAVLTIKIRKAEKKLRDEEERKKTIQLYNNLLNSLSHELRTPIATIFSAVDVLKDHQAINTNQQQDLVAQIDMASLRLNRQVENLLNMSRLESGTLKLNLQWCDVNELIFSEIRKINSASNNVIQYQAVQNLPLYRMDIGLIEQVLHNIIHNAIQHTRKGTEIEIKAVGLPDGLTIVVSDNGGGFPSEEINQVFSKFYRLSSAKSGGLGLGLSIVRGFVEAHNGTIQLTNNSSNGATFTINLPLESSYLNHLKNE